MFDNGSAFDGDDSAANAADDDAVDPSKVALLPGETATFANYINYTRGINGIMVDKIERPSISLQTKCQSAPGFAGRPG
jgi:hypothetical protein